MDYVVLVLRLIHIVGGIAWVGGALTMTLYVGPAAAELQETGQQFMRQLMLRTRFTQAMTGAAIMTVLAGAILYARDMSAGAAWQTSGPGIGYGVGAAFAIVGLGAGMVFGMTSRAMARLGDSIKGKPSDAQTADLAKLRGRLNFVGRVNVVSLLIAAGLMAIARYLVF